MSLIDYLPLLVTPVFGVLVIIVVGGVLLRDRWKARHGAEHLHPGE